jgi:hypothetical protein
MAQMLMLTYLVMKQTVKESALSFTVIISNIGVYYWHLLSYDAAVIMRFSLHARQASQDTFE